TATILLLPTLLKNDPATLAIIESPPQWGHDPLLRYAVGLPLFIAGVGSILILYIMSRARRIMEDLEADMEIIEQHLGEVAGHFRTLNHPRGLSGPILLRRFLSLGVATPMVFFGAGFMAGVVAGTGIWAACMGLW